MLRGEVCGEEFKCSRGQPGGCDGVCAGGESLEMSEVLVGVGLGVARVRAMVRGWESGEGFCTT